MKLRYLLLITLAFIFTFCAEDPQVWKAKSQEQLAGDYIANNPKDYSEFEKLMDETGMKSLLNVRGPFTVFLPTNDAMLQYYKLKKVNSLDDFSASFKNDLIRNHILNTDIREVNALGDYVVTEFEGSEIIVDKFSKIIRRDINTANGYIHVIDRVMDPVTEDIYTIVSSDPSYKIFSEGLSLTGLKDTLKIIDFPYGNKTARTRFTLLAVPDTVFNRHGISNVEDLIKWCGGNRDSLTYINNPFYRYMEYHCLNGSHYLSELNTTL